MRKRITRYECDIKAKVQLDNVMIVEARILNISLQGAFFSLADYRIFQNGDKWSLIFTLPTSAMSLQFHTEVIHSQNRLVGVKFVQMGNDTMTQLKSLIDVLASKPERMKKENELLYVE